MLKSDLNKQTSKPVRSSRPDRFFRTLFFPLSLLSLSILSTCNKYPDSENGPCPREPHFDLKNECHSIGPSTTDYGFNYAYIGTQFDQPRFNPRDADEFICHEHSGDFSRLVKYRISTGEKTTFLDPAPVNIEIDWGRGGWIAFSDCGNMYLIREDGTGLYQVPIPTDQTGYSCAEPDFNPDGTVVGFPFGGIDDISLYGMYLLHDLEKREVDTFHTYREVLNSTRPLAWSRINNMFIILRKSKGSDYDGLGYINMNTLEEQLLFAFQDQRKAEFYGNGDVCWNTNGQKFYSTSRGINSYSIEDYMEYRVKKGCESRYYEDITISPDDLHIVVERVDVKRSKPLSDTLEEQHRLFIMDINGCNERLLIGEE